jgi:serine/threonine protein kinase
MDLRPYGINIFLTPNAQLKGIQDRDIQEGTRSGTIVQLGTSRFKLIQELGRGTYGTTYRALGEDKKMYALKVQRTPHIPSFAKECIIHILLAKTSKDQENGPLVPVFYKVAYNEDKDEAYIVTERMEGTLYHFLKNHSKEENDVILPDAIRQITDTLTFFGDTLQFNHRDLKSDNIMYTRTPYGAYHFKLIDFGLSCLTWRGMRIQVEGIFDRTHVCYKKDRDIPQLLYALLLFAGRTYLSDNLLQRLYTILVSIIKGTKQCYMMDGCMDEGLNDWMSSYNFLNRPNITVPSARINRIKKHMNNFTRGKQFSTGNMDCQSEKKRLTRNNTRKLNRSLLTPPSKNQRQS